MKHLFCLLPVFFSNTLWSQEYSVSNIPDSLIANANVVKRYEERIITIKSPGKFISHERHVYTILNEKSSDYASYQTPSDRFTTIDYLSGVLYDENGKEVKHLKKAEMTDYTVPDWYTIANNTRFKECRFTTRSYPYHVDF
jgi:hypothetical protein